MSISDGLRKQLDTMVAEHKVVLFMKGNRSNPQCGFSAQVVQILDELVPTYETVDVLGSPELRDGIKEYSSWPTIPQLYISGQFVGGCDIVKEMNASGELQKTLGVTASEPTPPRITVSERAAKAFREAKEADGDELHLEIDARFQHGLFFGPKQKGEIVVDAGGLVILVDRASARRAEGVSIDFVDGPGGAGFKIDNPSEPPRVKQIGAKELKAMMDRGDRFELYDVRPEEERAIASIKGAHALDEGGQARLRTLDKATPVVFVCHHGIRSQAAADHYLKQGFSAVSNLRGGIEAWSTEVDPSVRRY